MKNVMFVAVAAMFVGAAEKSIAAASDGDSSVGRGDPSALLTEEKGYNPWHFRIGPVTAPRVRTHIRSPQMVLPAFPRDGSTASGMGSRAIPADPSAGYTERRYIDGYVRPDEGTANPLSADPGRTWDWGASDVPSQYSAVDQTMTYHTEMTRWTESYSSSSYMEGGSESDRDVLLGVEAMGGWTFWDNQTFDAAVDLGFRYYGSGVQSARSRCGASVTTTRNEYRYADVYDASGWTTMPESPYTGTPTGGRLLGAQPTRNEEMYESSQSYSSYSYRNETKLAYNIWDLRLGPTFGWHVEDWFAIRGGVYGLIGLVDAELKTATASSRGSSIYNSSKCTPVFGMAFSLMAQANLTDWMFLYGGIEYDWWTDKVAMDAGGSHAVLQMSDFSVSAGIGFEF